MGEHHRPLTLHLGGELPLWHVLVLPGLQAGVGGANPRGRRPVRCSHIELAQPRVLRVLSVLHCPLRRHWGELNIDHAENIPVAKRYGVLKEGIPNIKLFGLGAEPVPLMSGDVLTAAALAPLLKQQLGASGTEMDSSHFYLSLHADRSEL